MNVVPLALVLSLAAHETKPPAPPAPPEPEVSEPRDWSKPPPGAPEDQALWHALDDAHAESVSQMARVFQGLYRLRWGKYYELLGEKARSGTPAEAEGARRALEKVDGAARAADGAIPKQGLRVRVCKYTLLHLDQRMSFPDDPTFRSELPKYRAEAKGCVDELAPFAAKLKPLADAFEASLAEADAFLGRAAPQAPPGPAPEDGARPPGARERASP